MSTQQLTVYFFLQLTCILLISRAMSRGMSAIRQPAVIGEMIAGVLLGPSFFGLVAPSLQQALFPPETLPMIGVVSQLGLVLYMFVVGAHLQTDHIRRVYRSAFAISLAGVVVPFVLGAMLAAALYNTGEFFAPALPRWQAMMYLGSAMAVTAFPVLARIIQDRGIAGTMVGTLALAAGATDDAVAWSLLAIVLATLAHDLGIAVMTVGGGAAYVVVVLVLLRPQLRKLAESVERKGSLSPQTLTGLLALLMTGAWFTDRIGLHAVFGAFVMGAAMPRGLLTKEISRQIEPVATSLLIPLFFVYSGLSTHASLLGSWPLLLIALIAIAVASLGKVVGCSVAAVMTGHSRSDALAVGVLMNARGLMELIILNIGLERQLITPMLFTIMVLMTIATTVAAGPAFEWAWRRSASREMPVVRART